MSAAEPRRDGSITGVGSDMRSYYGRPVLKEPVWKPEVPAYFFTGGLAGASGVLHGIAHVTGHRRLARTSLFVAGAADAVSPVLLISDLGRPERFLNMLRVFKVTSPMSVGSWILVFSSGASVTAALLEAAGVLRRVKSAAAAVAFVSGPPLATYTGALIANTANPAWNGARRDLPWLFGASSAASAGAAASLLLPPDEARPARRLAVGAGLLELASQERMKRRLGPVGEVYEQGDAGRYGRAATACTAAGTALLALGGRRSRLAAATGGALVLAGGLALRWSVFRAGFQAARDPKYVVEPQRARVDARRDGARDQPDPASL